MRCRGGLRTPWMRRSAFATVVLLHIDSDLVLHQRAACNLATKPLQSKTMAYFRETLPFLRIVLLRSDRVHRTEPQYPV